MMHKPRPGQHKYVNPADLFDGDTSEDECDDTSFRQRIPPPNPKPTPKQHQLQYMADKRREIENRTLECSSRCIGHLLEAEESGISTAEELIRQREALENANRNLGGMMPKLETSQKHLNGIKSAFYGLKQFVSGNRDRSPSDGRASPSGCKRQVGFRGNKLDQTIAKITDRETGRSNIHPSTRLRGLDRTVSLDQVNHSIDEQFQSNLNDMCQVIAKLKGLGIGLGNEIEEQNELINKITDKVEKVDISVTSQNKQINKLLG